MVLSCGTPNRDELATQRQAAPNQTATVAGNASLGNRRGEQRRASAAERNRRTAIPSNSPVAENRCGVGAALPGRSQLSGDGRSVGHLGKQRWRETKPGKKGSERTHERETP